MAEAVVSVVLETVARLLVEESTFLSGVSAQVEDLCTELRQMQSFLRDADAKQHKDESVRNWLREIRSLAYRIEDLVEKYAIHAEAKRSSGRRSRIEAFLKKPLRICGKAGYLHKLGNEIETVKLKLSSISGYLQKYDIRAIDHGREQGESSNQQYQHWGRQTYDHQVEDYFVGMEDDIENLVSLVTSDERNHCIISILGMGGLGKTTIARKVFKHKDVQRGFERFAWTCVTQQPQVDVILQDLLLQLLPERKHQQVEFPTGRELVRQLHQVQTKSKCLIVLDDIWKVDHWKNMVAAFPLQQGKTKLLLTTRNAKVAGIGFPYKLKFLSEKEAWELLQQIASNGKTEFKVSPCCKEIGINLVSKCGGLPLAISLLGGILKNKSSLAEWEIVNKGVASYANKMEEGGGDARGSLDQVLSLSYDELPYHLKICFLYFGNFKEDKKIYAEHVYSLWITEGLVLSKHQRNGETLAQVAETYLRELGHRCMVQLKLDLGFDECSLHDVMRGFCLDKCREEEFLKVIRDSCYVTGNNNGAHRLVIEIENEVNVAALIASADGQDGKHARSLFCRASFGGFSGKRMIWPQDEVIQNFKRLRVLCFDAFDFGRSFPMNLQNMIHLRSLTLKSCNLEELPSSIADLPLLHVLSLEMKNRIKIPNVLWKMKRLRSLSFGTGQHYTDGGGKLRLYNLTELETLLGLDGEVDEIADLSVLSNIQDFECRVKGIENFYVLMDYIHGNGQNLRRMILEINDCDLSCSEKGYDLLATSFRGGRIFALTLNAKFVEFPCYEQQFLLCLKALTLGNNYMEEDPMETLGLLPHLEYLSLEYDSYIGESLFCHIQGFPQLHYLSLRGLPNLQQWRVDEGSMPKLSKLWIWKCPSLVMIPEGLQFARGLRALYIVNMCSEFCKRLEATNGREGLDFHKIQHVHLVHVLQV